MPSWKPSAAFLRLAGAIAFALAPASAAFAQNTPTGTQVSTLSNYRLGSGDVISIQVLGEDDLKRERIRLSDAATISYPILGEIRLYGKTVAELETLIREGLTGRYLVNPQVTVTIIEYRSFFINGQVEKPGGYAYMPGLTVRKAVSLAGGFKERASKEKIFVIRDDDPSKASKRVSQDETVHPGDIITVEESFF